MVRGRFRVYNGAAHLKGSYDDDHMIGPYGSLHVVLHCPAQKHDLGDLEPSSARASTRAWKGCAAGYGL